jgi:predicted nucleic acid-binding protein
VILVDSSVWIDYFRGATTPQAEKLDALLGTEPVAIGDLILTEVLQGFVSDRDFNQARNCSIRWTSSTWADGTLPFRPPGIFVF